MSYMIAESQVETVREKSITKVLNRSDRAILGTFDKSAKNQTAKRGNSRFIDLPSRAKN